MLSLRTMFDPAHAEDIDARIGFRIGTETFIGLLRRGRLDIERGGETDQTQLVLTGAASAIAAAIYGGQRLAALEAAGALAITGDRSLAERFVTLFPLPPKAVK